MSEPTDKEALEAFEDLPQEKRDAMRSAIRKSLVGMAEERGIPAERLVTPDVVDDLAVELLRSPAGDVNARMAEFFTKEERGTIYKEEKARLTTLYPEGIPAGMWLEAVKQRMEGEHPEAFRDPT